MKDSGKRQQFSTGAVRDTAADKPRLGLISPFFLRRLGAWLTLGAQKYAAWNWAKGMPYSRVVDSLERHLQAFKAGETDEDHLAAVAANSMFLIHYQEMLTRGTLPADLNDMPQWST